MIRLLVARLIRAMSPFPVPHHCGDPTCTGEH